MVNLTININDEHDPEKVEMLRSSAFLPGKTLANTALFFDTNAYPGHHACRSSLIEHSLSESTGFIHYQQMLARNGPLMDLLVGKCKKLVLILAYTPDWLSSSTDKTVFSGYWKKCNAMRPKSWITWQELVLKTAQWLKPWLGKGCEIYIEVWNEPDLDYWQDDHIALFTLYGWSARVIKTVDSRFKVGGLAVNWWMKEKFNENLISLCAGHNLPLDFVSWHQFASPTMHLSDAITAYDAAVEAAGIAPPEYIITEYNTGPQVRNSEIAVPALASMISGFVEEKVTHLVSAWEDFETGAKPDDYGLMTQIDNAVLGEPKPVYGLYRALDDLSRTSSGVRLYRDSGLYVLSCKSKEAGKHALLVWNPSLKREWAFALLTVDGIEEIKGIVQDGNSSAISAGNEIGLVVKPHAVTRIEFTF